MIAADKLVIETAEKKNAVESYVYEMRNRLSGNLSAFATDSVLYTYFLMEFLISTIFRRNKSC